MENNDSTCGDDCLEKILLVCISVTVCNSNGDNGLLSIKKYLLILIPVKYVLPLTKLLPK